MLHVEHIVLSHDRSCMATTDNHEKGQQTETQLFF